MASTCRPIPGVVDKSSRVAIAALAAGVVLGATLLTLSATEFPHTGEQGPPVGVRPPLTLSGSADAATGSGSALETWYNFSVEEVSSSLTLERLTFDLKTPTGSNLTAPPGSGVDILASNWTLEANFSIGGAGTYAPGYGPSTHLATANVVSLFYTGLDPMSLAGDSLFVSTSPGACVTVIT
jgi:hypothetical protein